MGKVTTVIHGNRLRTWFANTNTIQQAQLPNKTDPYFILEHLWKELLTKDDLIVLPLDQDDDDLWHVWIPTQFKQPRDSKGEYESVHFWVHSVDGIPRKMEYWQGDGCIFREDTDNVEWNVPVTRREFTLPRNAQKMKLWNLRDVIGGLVSLVDPLDALQECPFPLMGLDINSVRSLGVRDAIQIKTYYKGKEWAVRYGPPIRSREILQGAPCSYVVAG